MAKDEKQSLKKHLSLVLRLGIAVLACWIIFKDLNFAQLGETFKHLNGFVFLAAILIFVLGQFMIGFRWWVFLKAQKIAIPFFMAVKLIFLGNFFTNFMPSAVGGDLVRAWYISRHTHKKLQAALGVLADRVMGLGATFILAFSSYLLFMRGHEEMFQMSRKENGLGTFLEQHHVSSHMLLTGGVILIGVLFIIADIWDLKRFYRKLTGFIRHSLEQIREVFLVYYHHPLILMFGLSFTILLQSMVILSLWYLGHDLGIVSPLRFYFVFFPMVWVIGSIPISIAGLGILEGGLVFLFVQFTDANPETVMALALCQRLTWIIASLPGLVVHLTGAHRNKED